MSPAEDDPLARTAFIAAREAGIVSRNYGWTAADRRPRTITDHQRGQWALVAGRVALLIQQADAEIDRVLPSRWKGEAA